MATRILTYDEYVLKMYDFDGSGKIDKAAERLAYKRALNNRNHAATEQAYAQYVALAEAANKNEREAQQQQALLAAAGTGNEAATTILTGESKTGTAKSIIVYLIIGAALIAFILKGNK